jgi:hypothetical protein
MIVNNVSDYDIFVDFGDGDKFKVEISEVHEYDHKIILKGSQGSLDWVRMEVKHPIKSNKYDKSNNLRNR